MEENAVRGYFQQNAPSQTNAAAPPSLSGTCPLKNIDLNCFTDVLNYTQHFMHKNRAFLNKLESVFDLFNCCGVKWIKYFWICCYRENNRLCDGNSNSSSHQTFINNFPVTESHQVLYSLYTHSFSIFIRSSYYTGHIIDVKCVVWLVYRYIVRDFLSDTVVITGSIIVPTCGAPI